MGQYLLAQEEGLDTYQDCFHSSYEEKSHPVSNCSPREIMDEVGMMWMRSVISHIKKVVLFAVVTASIVEGMNYLYVDDTDEFARYMLHELYEEDDNIDRLYLGSSHVFCGIDPLTLDDINGENNFNLSTGTQQLITSYYLLKEADKKHEIDRVYLDLYYNCTVAGLGNFHDYQSIPYSWIVLHQMRPSINRLSYMLNLSSPEYYYLTFLAFTRYKEKLFDLDYVSTVVNAKQSEIWKNYEYRHVSRVDDREYVMQNGEKGFRIYHGTPEYGGFYRTDREAPLGDNPITPESLEYLQKIVEYCKEHEIALTWIGCPISDYQLVRNGAYDNFVRQVSELAKEYDVSYYDFNLCRREYLDLSQKEYWADMGHLNTKGAEIFTQFLGNFLLAEESAENTYKECFYSSYEEKIRDSREEIYGLEITKSQEYERCMPEISEEEKGEYVIYKVRPVTNAKAENVKVKIVVTREDDEGSEVNTILHKEGLDTYIAFSQHEHGVLYTEARLRSSSVVTNWAEVEF